MSSHKIHILAHTPSDNTKEILKSLYKGCEYGFSCMEGTNTENGNTRSTNMEGSILEGTTIESTRPEGTDIKDSNMKDAMPSANKGEVVTSAPLSSNHTILDNCDGILILTTENFGYMSGALKDWFDRCFYELENKHQGLPYALCVRAQKDGTGTCRSVSAITKGLKWRAAAEPKILKGTMSQQLHEEAYEYGARFSAGLLLGLH